MSQPVASSLPLVQRLSVKTPFYLFKAMRPHHWIKNLVVFACALFALKFDLQTWLLLGLTFMLFSLVSSSFYLINDSIDVEADRQHPVKCKRPIAAGLVPIPLAIAAAVVCLVTSLVASLVISPNLTMALTAYALIQVAYNLGLKREPIIDIMCISAGFVLRALGGAAAADVVASSWLVLCVGLLAFYLGIEKRKAECRSMGNGGKTRAVLKQYSLSWLTRMESLVTASTLMAYALWTVEGARTDWMLVTLPFVAFGIFKYQQLSELGEGETPESTLLKNPYILWTVVLWVGTCLGVLLLVQ